MSVGGKGQNGSLFTSVERDPTSPKPTACLYFVVMFVQAHLPSYPSHLNYIEPHGFLVEACAVGVYQALSPDLGTRLIC